MATIPSLSEFHTFNSDPNDNFSSSNQLQGLIRPRSIHRSDHFKFSTSLLPNFFKACDHQSSDPFPSSVFINNPNPVRLPVYLSYPPQSPGQSRFFCCDELTTSPIYDFLKAVIEHIYHTVLDEDIQFSSLHVENHQKLHRALLDMKDCLEALGMLKMYDRISKTFADGRAADVLINCGLNPERKSYSNASGEYVLTKNFIRDAFSYPETQDSQEYSELQPVSQYFLQQLQLYSATQQSQRLILEEMPNNSSVFIIRTNRRENRPYLPMLFALGMIIGCPYAGYLSSKVWVFRKEMLYLCAKLFGMLDINITTLLLNLLMEDIEMHSRQQKIFCRPLWRVLMSVERSYDELECLSHVPRTLITVVEMSRFAEIVMRYMPLIEISAPEIMEEQARIMTTYESNQQGLPKTDWLKAILMYERLLLNVNLPQFVPRLKWVHARNIERKNRVATSLGKNSQNLTQ